MQTAGANPDLTQDHDEARLVELARVDASAFARLYRIHYPAIVGHLYRRTGDPHAAEDLAAETFLSAFKAIPRYQITGTPLRIWLMRIATNAANHWASERQKLRLTRVAAPDPQPAPGESQATLEEAQAALLALSPDHQAVLSLHYLESLSLEEVASILDCKLGTVKSRLARARDAMREELEQRSTRNV